MYIKKFANKRLIIVLVLVVVCAVGAVVVYNKIIKDKNSLNDVPQTSGDAPSFTNDTPTEEEKEALNLHNEQRVNSEPNPSQGKRTVVPVITSALQGGDEVTVSAYVPGIVEEGGTCIMEAKKGSSVVTKSVKAFGDASTTNCPLFFVKTSDFSGEGEWSVVVSYSSDGAAGSSQTKTLTVK